MITTIYMFAILIRIFSFKNLNFVINFWRKITVFWFWLFQFVLEVFFYGFLAKSCILFTLQIWKICKLLKWYLNKVSVKNVFHLQVSPLKIGEKVDFWRHWHCHVCTNFELPLFHASRLKWKCSLTSKICVLE